MDEYKLCYKSTALKILGITDKNFNKLNIVPEKIVKNPYYSKSPPSKLYDRKQIEKLVNSPEVKALKPKKRKKVDYFSKFEKKYTDKNEALPDVLNRMFNLNRYCKHETCSWLNKKEIYELKNQLIERLYQDQILKRLL